MIKQIKTIPLKKTCNITTGKLDSNHFVENGKYPFFTCAPKPLKIDSYAFDSDVILIAGNNAQGNFHINKFKGKFNAYQRTYVLTTKKGYSLSYLFYSLKLELKRLKEKSQGSQTKFLTMPILNSIKIDDLDFTDQQKIAYALSTLDEKIELNNRINTELEKMAKTLYDYWFVQFDFPDKNGNPYKSSGGKMVWSEKLKREIPAGWEVKRISDLFTFQKGVEPGASEYKEKKESEDDILFYRVGDIDGSSKTFVNSKNKKYHLMKENDVIVTFDGSVGKMGFGLNGAYSGGLQKIYDQTGKFDNSLVYSLFRDERIIAIIHQYATGSIILHASSAIKHLNIPFDEEKYLEFQKIIKPIFTKLVKNKAENQKLAELRDWLLPMLMNGQVEVV